MTPILFRRLSTCGLIALALAFAACGPPKRPPVLAGGGPLRDSRSEGQPADAGAVRSQTVDEGPDVRAIDREGPAGSDLAAASAAGGDTEGGPLADVRFLYDSAQLTEEARGVLEKHAAWLQSHREVKLIVEGHCDERGTVEYNLALGEQRARTVRDYLVSLGVVADRLKIASYGKERPLDPAATEEAYARNRRAHFAVAR
jgi:peptidoglycan-associated lipoprotein